MVRRYNGLEALVAAEGWHSVEPDAEDSDDAISRVRASRNWDEAEESQYGVLSLRVREARRKGI